MTGNSDFCQLAPRTIYLLLLQPTGSSKMLYSTGYRAKTYHSYARYRNEAYVWFGVENRQACDKIQSEFEPRLSPVVECPPPPPEITPLQNVPDHRRSHRMSNIPLEPSTQWQVTATFPSWHRKLFISVARSHNFDLGWKIGKHGARSGGGGVGIQPLMTAWAQILIGCRTNTEPSVPRKACQRTFQPEIWMNGEGRARTAAGLGTVGRRWAG